MFEDRIVDWSLFHAANGPRCFGEGAERPHYGRHSTSSHHCHGTHVDSDGLVSTIERDNATWSLLILHDLPSRFPLFHFNSSRLFQHADVIIVVQKGDIIETGNHASLMAKEVYRRL
jgi:hypothetical protein